MSFRVFWTKDAQTQLTNIWLESADRNGVTKAVAEFESDVAIRPQSIGESRIDNVRMAFIEHLGFVFEADEENLVVIVGSIWVTRQ